MFPFVRVRELLGQLTDEVFIAFGKIALESMHGEREIAHFDRTFVDLEKIVNAAFQRVRDLPKRFLVRFPLSAFIHGNCRRRDADQLRKLSLCNVQLFAAFLYSLHVYHLENIINVTIRKCNNKLQQLQFDNNFEKRFTFRELVV